jgi:hypothetical protein
MMKLQINDLLVPTATGGKEACAKMKKTTQLTTL